MILGLAEPIVASIAAGKITTKIGTALAANAKMVAIVSEVVGHFAMVAFMIPAFFENPVYSWEFQKNAAMVGQMVGQSVLTHMLTGMAEKLTQYVAEKAATRVAASAADAAASAAAEAATGIMEVAATSSAEVMAEMAASAAAEMMQAGAAALGYIGGAIAVGQIAGMIADSFDPCNLQSESMNLKQESLDLMRTAYDKAMLTGSPYPMYPYRADPKLVCDYKLDCATTFNSCLSAEEKKNYKNSNDYCKQIGDKDLYNQYTNEYLKSLTVNSTGECIGKITNSVLANYFNTYVGGIDWSFIAEMNTSDFQLPHDSQLKVLNLLIANQNTLVAGYINQNFYYILTAFILIVVILFVV
jgi:hypothetical protein